MSAGGGEGALPMLAPGRQAGKAAEERLGAEAFVQPQLGEGALEGIVAFAQALFVAGAIAAEEAQTPGRAAPEP